MKNKSIYRTMAAQNIKKNRKMYLPYIFTFVGMAAMFYIIVSLATNPTLANMDRGSRTVPTILSFGMYIAAIFAVIFLFYTNSFLIKRRKKELGLYNILGMEKRHVSRVLMWENILILAVGLGGGILIGALFDRLMFMILVKMLGEAMPIEFYFSWNALGWTAALFSAITVLIHLNSMRQVHFSKPIDLLKGGNVGEREPKTKLIMAILGAVSLGAGYYISATTKNPIDSLVNFFIAVMLVIVGTYLIFTAGSIALLKLLRKNKKYYYKPNHFISISGMVYRMKQNAVGLANICILCSAVIITISTTVSLRIGTESAVRNQYPYDVFIGVYDNESEPAPDNAIDIIHEAAQETLDNLGLKMGDSIDFTVSSFYAALQDDVFVTDYQASDSNQIYYFEILSLDEYNKMTGSNETLKNDEVLYGTASGEYNTDIIKIFDKAYTVKNQIKSIPPELTKSYSMLTFLVVVKDNASREFITDYVCQKSGMYKDYTHYYYFNIDGGSSDLRIKAYEEFHNAISEKAYEQIEEGFGITYGGYDISLKENINMYSGLLFVGIFMGILFLAATVLIIYYKQLTEGHEDFARYQIMQKVGLTPREIKSSINSQVMTVFFLPLVTAVIHMCFAFPMMNKFLSLNDMDNTSLYLACMVASIAIFAVIYTIIYFITSRIYYGIVTQKNDY